MTDIVLFHHAGGLTPGVIAFADRLRDAGHTVHTPDVFEGKTFAVVDDGVAYAEHLGQQTLTGRAAAAVEPLPRGLVYIGMSLGCALAAGTLLQRGDARAAVFLYGAIAPSWWGASWPEGVPAQSHQTTDDPWREAEVDEAMRLEIPSVDLYLYPGGGHLFAEVGHPDYDEAAAEQAMERVLALVGAIR